MFACCNHGLLDWWILQCLECVNLFGSYSLFNTLSERRWSILAAFAFVLVLHRLKWTRMKNATLWVLLAGVHFHSSGLLMLEEDQESGGVHFSFWFLWETRLHNQELFHQYYTTTLDFFELITHCSLTAYWSYLSLQWLCNGCSGYLTLTNGEKIRFKEKRTYKHIWVSLRGRHKFNSSKPSKQNILCLSTNIWSSAVAQKAK